MEHQKKSVINLKDVRFSWTEGTPVLDIPELELYQGEKVFIRGPSGSGKTTLLGLLGGVITAEQGQVNILGSDISRMSSSRRDEFRASQIGFIFQMFNLIPYLSVVENVTLPLDFSKSRLTRVTTTGRTPEQEAVRLLAHLGLSEPTLISRPVTELSIGQQQRVAAARALIGRPALVIADEPTSALDTEAREAFIRLLFDECEASDSTLVFVSHDPTLEPLFDRSISLHEVNRVSTYQPAQSPIVSAMKVA
ncbi:methionine ABC transporter ATP-binding protein [Endozoicomonas sp. (ex Bugula neritina AB1)]|nr:methionine ABC transporter ATP-binding protein [Endozoicomonas sp. (ex Bugula neritina AB1)]